MNLKLSILTAVAATTCAASAANVIAFNFGENWGAKSVKGETVYGTDQWTDSVELGGPSAGGYTAANSTDADTVTAPFNAPGVSVAWSSSNVYQAGDETNSGINQVFRMYLDDGGAGPTITVTGLSTWLAGEGATGYEVTFFRNSDVAGNTFAEMNLYNGTGTGGTLLETLNPTLTDGSGSGSGSRLIQSTTGSFDSDVITFHTDRDLGTGGQRAGISGFMITAVAVPEPSSTALLGLGGLALILRRRK